jgi:hypothetical protein
MSDELKCKECGRALLSEDELEEHMMQHDRARDLFQCDKCKLSLQTREELESHIRMVHESSA